MNLSSFTKLSSDSSIGMPPLAVTGARLARESGHPRLTNPLQVSRAGSSPPPVPKAKLAALVELGQELKRQEYTWICPSIETQTLVNGRFANRRAHNLPDLFGWNREGTLDTLARLLPVTLVEALCDTGVLQITDGETVRSRVRFSSFGDTLLAHSAWPAQQRDTVLAGPEMQRFAAFIARELQGPFRPIATPSRPFTLVDLGCGSGAAGILATRLLTSIDGPSPTLVLLTDRNAGALRFAEVNARLANLPHFECRQSDGLSNVSEAPMLVLSNTPGLIDPQMRPHLHGGGELGTGLALRILDECMDQMLPGGTLLMCAVAPVTRGVDVLWRSVEPRIARSAARRVADVRYQMLESDVFCSHLAHPAYAEVDRLSLVGITVHMSPANTPDRVQTEHPLR